MGFPFRADFMAYYETNSKKDFTMTIKNSAKNAAFAVGMFVFPIKAKPVIQPKLDTGDFDIDAYTAALQASFKYAVKDDLTKNL